MKYYYHPESDSYCEFTEEQVENLTGTFDFELCVPISKEEYLKHIQPKENNTMNPPIATKSVLNEQQVVTGEVRLSYVNLFDAKKFNESDKDAKFSVTILIPKNTPDGQKTIAKIKQAIQKAAEKGAQKHFGGRVPTNVSHTLRDGDTEVDDLGDLKNIKSPELKGHMYMRLSTKFQPKVLNSQRQEILNPLEVYSGCYGKVSLTTFAYSDNGKRGVSAVLNNVMKTNDGEPLTSHLTGDEFDSEE